MPGFVPPPMLPQTPQQQADVYAAAAAKAAGKGAPLGPPIPGPGADDVPPRGRTALQLDHPFANRTRTLAAQAMLKHLGYNVGIDGVVGPQTLSAFKAWQTGVHPNAWAEAYTAHHHGVTPPPPHDPSLVPPTTPVAPPPPPGKTTPPPAPPGAPGATTDPGLIDPAAFARASADAQYNPQIAALVRQIADAKAQEGSTEGDLKNWYAKLVGDTGAAATANAADAHTILGGHDSAAAGLVAALGGSASAGAADAGANAQIGRNELESLGLSNSSFDRNIGRAYAGEGITALGDQHRQYANDLHDALSKQIDLEGAKGNAYTSALQNALVERTNQAKTQMDTQVEAGLSGIQTKQAAANLAGTVLSNNINKWRYQQGIKDAASGGAGSVPEFTKQNPGQLSQLQNNLLNGLLGPKGNFNSDPAQAFTKMAGTLSSLSYGKWDPATNPAAKTFVNNVIGSRLAAWNAQNPNKKYALKGGQIVRI